MTVESSLAKNGYSDSLTSTGSARGIEYEIFARVTQDLSKADEKANDYYAKLSEALYKNLRLWAALADDIGSEHNKLPLALKSQLVYLAEFTRRHTAKVFNGEAKPAILVEINTSIMRGLRGVSNSGSVKTCPAV